MSLKHWRWSTKKHRQSVKSRWCKISLNGRKIIKEAYGSFTCACSSTNRDQMSPVLCNGLDWQLVLTEWPLLHNGDCCHGSSLRALDDATDSTYRWGCHGGSWLHFYYRGAEPHRLEQKSSLLCHCRHCYWFRLKLRKLTFELLMLVTSVFLRFCAHFCCRLCGNCCHSDSWDLVDNLHRLHHRSGGPRRSYDGWCCHGIGYRLDGCLRHGTMNSYQHRLVVEGGCYYQAYTNWIYNIKMISTLSTFANTFSSTLTNFTFSDRMWIWLKLKCKLDD